ncbi:uncharacterized protein LOC131957127 [Physella acuta]|uniref:uncharacterized protein LOC131957127 n=1 Tax=Physella acuta TaxID=109671 RepID=UPI0027DC9FF8|nr:uncharacterized protein LOC131957127 [Physella acuta]
MQVLHVFFFGSALVALSQSQDMTSMMFQALGIEMPPMPPTMPQSLREHLYPAERQRLLNRQRALQQAFSSAPAPSLLKSNPYSTPYSAINRTPDKQKILYSGANTIRSPGTLNTLAGKANPYSISRASVSGLPSVRNNPMYRRQGVPNTGVYQTMRVLRDQPKKINEAKAAGCKLPIDSTAASVLMFGDCRNPAAKMVCQVELMTCMNVGMSAMCCPYGMNKLAMDTISYVNKLQHFMSEIA